MQKQLDAYIRLNEALAHYLAELEQIDLELFKKETEQYKLLLVGLETANSEEELNIVLRKAYTSLGLDLPYKGDFDKDVMQNPSAVLVFK